MQTESRGHRETAPEARHHVLLPPFLAQEEVCYLILTGEIKQGTELQGLLQSQQLLKLPADLAGLRIHSALEDTVPSWGGSGDH